MSKPSTSVTAVKYSLGGRLALCAADLRLLTALLLDLLQRGTHDRAVELGGLACAVVCSIRVDVFRVSVGNRKHDSMILTVSHSLTWTNRQCEGTTGITREIAATAAVRDSGSMHIQGAVAR